MIEFMLVPAPSVFPFACVGCMAAKGPLMDTHRELPGYGHVYVCQRCLKTGSTLVGFASGERLDELEQAAGMREELVRQIDSLQDDLAKAKDQRAKVSRHDQALAHELEGALARIRQLEAVLSDQASQSLSLVGAAGGNATS